MGGKRRKMNEGQVVDCLLTKEREMLGIIHSAITEMMRHGVESERGKDDLERMTESLRYIIEDIERIINR